MLWAKGCQWPPWGFLHENSRARGFSSPPLECHNEAGENRASYFLRGTQERFPWIFFVTPLRQKPRTNEPTSHLQTLPFREINLGCAEGIKKVPQHHRMITPVTFTPSVCHKMFQNYVMMNHETAVIYIPGNFRSWMLTMKLQSCSWEFPFLDVLGVRGFFVSNFISSPSLPITISIPFMQRSWTKKTTYFWEQLVWEGPISNLTSKTGRNGPLRTHDCPSKRKKRHPQSRDLHSLKLT